MHMHIMGQWASHGGRRFLEFKILILNYGLCFMETSTAPFLRTAYA